ncbi:inositol monophosphatase family protein [Desulfosporosinus acidiphilus]|uniref:inositol monophosphatase family protein n=1 Tax=Desulfosporosinus acidiphilus TaxID=885581 RepID=UPI00059D3DB2|nr:inositol monophosphatase family protein [Desulfosporosinus acidiphilus]
MIRREAIRIARLAGDRIRELRENNQYEESLKDGYELVTTADLISNDLIKTEISKIFPDHNFVSEEDNVQKEMSIQNPTWIIDPIDGTVGYANNQYQVAVSIAFAVENEVRVGVVYNPFLDEMFYAYKNFGAFLNNKLIKVKDVDNLRECVIGTGFPHKRDNIRDVIVLLENILPKVRDIRRLGSPALDICWVACGRMQGFYEGKLHPWDVAAAKLIAIEAGAKTGYYGQRIIVPDCLNGNSIIVSSPGVFDEFQKVLSK